MEAIKLTNPEFDLEFAGKAYKVRRANIEKVILFQTRMLELADKKDAAIELHGAAYCIYLLIKDADPSVTEEFVMQNAPGDFDPYAIFETLGFMNRQKVELMKALMLRNAPVKERSGESSTES